MVECTEGNGVASSTGEFECSTADAVALSQCARVLLHPVQAHQLQRQLQRQLLDEVVADHDLCGWHCRCVSIARPRVDGCCTSYVNVNTIISA